MLGRRRLVAFCVVTVSVTAMFVAACGIDIIGTLVPAPSDSGPRPEASLPDLGDGSFADEDVRVLDPCGAVVGRGPTMVPVRNDAGFCIDRTEVTIGQYRGFLRDLNNGNVPDAGPQCPPRTPASFEPKQPASTPDDTPISNVDWCAAVTFCAWSGKHLCSGEADGGEWLRACARNDRDGGRTGDCHTAGGTSLEAVPFADGGCPANSADAFDMIGNVSEWTSSCVGSTCTARGGDFSSGLGATCYTAEEVSALLGAVKTGFRCCR